MEKKVFQSEGPSPQTGSNPSGSNPVGVVVIGRNEGHRLIVCLDSLTDKVEHIVYVDSGSVDDSVKHAEELNVNVVQLNMNTPFTAARARNVGFAALMEIAPHIEYVQFVDGDCEVVDSWLESALDYLDAYDEAAVVCGRRRERYPRDTIYNMMCDLEWNTPVGEAKACGGDALIRVKAFKQVAGYKESLIAGEEPELCVRLRKNGWKIERLDEEMTLHDAAISTYSQWWKRTKRAGYAYAEGSFLHGSRPERHWVKESLRILFWALLLPILIFITLFFHWQVSLALVYLYLFQYVRLALKNMQKRRPFPWKLAGFSLMSKFAEFQGFFQFYKQLASGKQAKIIEYK